MNKDAAAFRTDVHVIELLNQVGGEV